MGLSSSTTKTKPIFEKEITGAANTVTGAYNAAAPGIAASASAIGGLIPGMIDKYNAGDPNVTAARGYDADVLGGKYLDAGNPYLEQQVTTTNNNTRNGVAASLGTRGLTGGSAFGDIISRALAQNESGLRYNDYNAERGRMDAAAGRAPQYTASDATQLQSIIAAMTGQMAPIQAAAGYGSSIGGLLGQYTSTKQTQPIGSLIAGLGGSVLSGWASGGFK